MKLLSPRLLTAAMFFLLAGCSSGDYQDLDAFMAEKKSQPAGHIKPIPAFKAYKAFAYSATSMRSPFNKPVEVTEITRLRMASNVKPDPNRTKEYLEQFSVDSLSMVGSLEQANVLWALMLDREGGVHRVKENNFIGRNHGKVVEATETYISVIEIVPNGVDGWMERPRTIKLKTIED